MLDKFIAVSCVTKIDSDLFGETITAYGTFTS
jgi:hypothetical protein